MEKLKIEYVPIDSIKPYKNNAKLHPQDQIEQIKKSILAFDNCDPIGVWNNEIVEGHGRYIALKELGRTEIPIVRLDHLTDEQRKAYALIHNKTTMNSGWDEELLDLELDELEELEDIDMRDFGFELSDGGGWKPLKCQKMTMTAIQNHGQRSEIYTSLETIG